MPAPFQMWWMPAERSGPAEQLTNIGTQQSAASWSPGGRALAFTQVSAEDLGDIYVLDVAGGHNPWPFAQSRFDEGSPRFSPDGRWIAFCSNESGRGGDLRASVPNPGLGPRIQVSVDGGRDPVWSRHGGELYYPDGDKIMAVTVTTRPTFAACTPSCAQSGPPQSCITRSKMVV
jgi:Tol biopolymer transport system component